MTQFQNISISQCVLIQIIVHGVTCDTVSEHQYISHEYCNNIVHGVTSYTVSEHQYISHVYWNRILYMEWHVIQFQNICLSLMCIEIEYCAGSDTWNSFRTSVNLTCILKQNIVHGVTCDRVSEYQYNSHEYWNNIVQSVTRDTVSEHQYISHAYWNIIFYSEWHVIQFQNISISHMYIETEYCTWSNMWHNFRTSVYLTCVLKQIILHGVTCDTVSEHQYISHAYRNRILYIEWHVIQFQNIRIFHMHIETEYCTWSDMWYSFRTSVYLTCILKQNILYRVTCDTVSEHQYISRIYWNRILYMGWHVIVSEHQYISHVCWNRILYMEWHLIQFQNINISHVYWTEYCTWSDMW